jgi:hypothetical protein
MHVNTAWCVRNPYFRTTLLTLDRTKRFLGVSMGKYNAFNLGEINLKNLRKLDLALDKRNATK